MQKDIHPEYIETTVTCGCGETFTTRSTQSKISVEVCSKCHPFYTGKQKFVDAAGRVERFKQRFKKTTKMSGDKSADSVDEQANVAVAENPEVSNAS